MQSWHALPLHPDLQDAARSQHACTQVTDFRLGRHMLVLVASYETMRKHAPALQGCADLLICDEVRSYAQQLHSPGLTQALTVPAPRRATG